MVCAAHLPAPAFWCWRTTQCCSAAGGRNSGSPGIGDQLAFPLGHGRFLGVDDLPWTTRKIKSDDLVVLLVHEPDIFPKVPDRVALTLAGYIHGGQVRAPLIWPLFVPSKYWARRAYGHIAKGAPPDCLRGLGTSVVPARLGVPPEIVHVTLGAA